MYDDDVHGRNYLLILEYSQFCIPNVIWLLLHFGKRKTTKISQITMRHKMFLIVGK